jgi:HlyD family secretion protein
MKKRGWISLVIVVAVIGGAAFYYTRVQGQSSQQATYQTTTVKLGSITQSVSSSGSVRAMQSAQVDWQTSGQVSKVEVQVGQQVQAGQELAALDPTSVSPAVLNAQQTLVDAKNSLQSLQASTLTTTQAQQALANAQANYTTAQNALSALQIPTNANNTTIKQNQADLLLAQQQLQKMESKYGTLTKLQPTTQSKANKVLKLATAQTAVDNAQKTVDWAQGSPSANDIAVAQANLAVAQSQLADAQQQYDQVKNGVTPDTLAAAQAAVDAAQATVNEIRLTAPISGTVTSVGNMPGDLVSAGTTGIEIDNLSSQFVDVVVSEIDINKIQVGQAVQLSFDAIPNKTYNGKVTTVGTVGTSSQGVVNFPVTVQLTDADAQVKPGMSAAVSIAVATDNNVLLVPNQAVRSLGTQHTVTVLYQGQLIPVQVTTGISNDTMTEISGGQLKEGDTIVLNPSATSTSGGGSFGGGRGGGGGIPFGRFGG